MMASLTLTSPDLKQFAKLMADSPEITIRQTTIAIKKGTLVLEGLSKRESPADTGRLRSSIVSTTKPMIGTVTPTVKYATFVHDGTKAHTILPVKKRALRYKSGGRLVFSRKVRHPGTKANPFMTRALRKGTPKVLKFFDQAITNIVNQLAK